MRPERRAGGLVWLGVSLLPPPSLLWFRFSSLWQAWAGRSANSASLDVRSARRPEMRTGSEKIKTLSKRVLNLSATSMLPLDGEKAETFLGVDEGAALFVAALRLLERGLGAVLVVRFRGVHSVLYSPL